jgi:tripartite-type tricarboxylate transporter receptor subunit TctC
MKRRPFVKYLGMTAVGASVSPFQFSFASPTYPLRPVKIIVPLAPGGGSDAIGRLLAANLSEKFGQSFIVENRPEGGINHEKAPYAKTGSPTKSLSEAIDVVRPTALIGTFFFYFLCLNFQ